MSGSQTCYWPGSSNPVSGYRPCRTDTKSGHSACCDAQDTCTDTGYCAGSAGLYYRGGCTDHTFQDVNCPSSCITGFESTYANIVACGLNLAVDSGGWSYCCSPGSNSTYYGCCDQKFHLNFGRQLAQTSTSTMTVTPTISAQATGIATTIVTTTVTATSASSSNTSTKSSTAGLAASITLGMLFLFASMIAIFLALQLKRLRRRMRVHPQILNGAVAAHQTGYQNTPVEIVEKHGTSTTTNSSYNTHQSELDTMAEQENGRYQLP